MFRAVDTENIQGGLKYSNLYTTSSAEVASGTRYIDPKARWAHNEPVELLSGGPGLRSIPTDDYIHALIEKIIMTLEANHS